MRRTVSKVLIVMAFAVLIYACGSSDGTGYQTGPAPTAPPPSSGPAPTFAQVQPIIQANCAKCHNGSNQPTFTEANFKSSTAKDELTSGGMPLPPNTISAGDKAQLLAYLGS